MAVGVDQRFREARCCCRSAALKVWRDDACGPLCVVLLVSGWTLPIDVGVACASLALAIWVVRSRFSAFEACFRWAVAAVGLAIGVWISTKAWAIVAPASGRTLLSAVQIRDIFGLRVPAVLFGTLAWWSVRTSRTAWVPMLSAVLLAALSIYIWPASFKESHVIASAADVGEFAVWSNAVPPTSTVLVAPPRDVGAFVWFTLQRPNYLAVDQSAGVVFSRATSMEVQRRSQILLPLMEPNWRILTRLRAGSVVGRNNEAATRPLTSKSLTQVCTDPQLGFVISQEKVGFEPLRHEHAGAWKDWNLYDCRKVRPESRFGNMKTVVREATRYAAVSACAFIIDITVLFAFGPLSLLGGMLRPRPCPSSWV